MPDESQIPASRVPIIEQGTTLITREWFRFFNFVYNQLLALGSPAYGSFSSFETTSWSSFSTNKINITNTDLSNGVTLADSRVTVSAAGTYAITACFQLYNTDTTIPRSIILWARANGVNVPASLRYITVPGNNNGGAQSFGSHSIDLTLQLPALGYIEFYGASAGGQAQLRTIAAGEIGIDAPSSASIILNVTKIA